MTTTYHRVVFRFVCALLLAATPAAAQFDLGGLLDQFDQQDLEKGLSTLSGNSIDDILQATAEKPTAGAGADGAPTGPAGPPSSSGFILGPDQLLEFHARNLPVADAFAQLRQAVRMNIVVTPEVIAWFSGDLYDMTAEQAVAAICRSTNLIARRHGAMLVIEPDQPETRIYELYYARAQDALAVVLPLLSPLGQASASALGEEGIASNPETAGGQSLASFDTLIVHDVSRVLDVVDAVIARVDAEPLQVLVEATVMSIELTDALAFGVDFYALQGVDFADGGVTSLDGQSLTFNEPGFGSDTIDNGVGSASTGLTGGLPGGGLSVAILRDGIGAFFKALQEVSNISVLAHPKITTLNKQRGEVLLGRRDGFLTSIVTQTATTEQVEFLETGTRLIFRPFITPSGYVRLEVHPEDSDGGINSDGLPFKETAEVTTNVIVADGETVVIGGLFREREQTVEKKVPVLGDIPGVGGLFRSENSRFVREEIVIMLTPHIVGPDGEWLDVAAPAPASRRVASRGEVMDGRFRDEDVIGRWDTPISAWTSTHPTPEPVVPLQPDAGSRGLGGKVAMAKSKAATRGLSTRTKAICDRVRKLIDAGRPAGAEALLDSLTPAERSHPYVRTLEAKLDPVGEAGPSVDARLARRILDDL